MLPERRQGENHRSAHQPTCSTQSQTSQPAGRGPAPTTSTPAAILAQPQQEGTGSPHKGGGAPGAPGSGDQGDGTTGPHRTPFMLRPLFEDQEK